MKVTLILSFIMMAALFFYDIGGSSIYSIQEVLRVSSEGYTGSYSGT